MAAKLGALDPIHVDGDHAIVWAAPLLVQVRRGPMTPAVLDAIERRTRDLRLKLRPGTAVAAVALLEESAAVVKGDLRARQQRIVRGLLEGLDVRLAPVVMGYGLTSTLQRTLARGIALAHRGVRVTASPEEAAAWVAPHVGVTPAEVLGVINQVRALGK